MMSFSARQLHCLDAMGLVAWTCRSAAPASELAPVNRSAVKTQEAQLAQPQCQSAPQRPVSGAAMPAGADQLGHWLVQQPLSRLTYKGSQTNCIGSDQAALLVVCLQADASVPLPLSRECAQLLDLMMRAIDRPRSGYRQCAMSAGPIPHTGESAATQYLDDILTPHTRAVLILDPFPAPDSASDKLVLPQSSIPLWRVPHPELLMATPALKRRAWEALKSLKQALDVS